MNSLKILVIGIGNEIKSDDAVGLEIVESISQDLKTLDKDINFKTSISGRIFLLDEIKGYDKVFLVDSIKTEDGSPGDWYILDPSDIESESGFFASHNINLGMMEEIGDFMGEDMPEISIYAVEVQNPFEFGEELTNEMQEEIKTVKEEIQESIENEI